MSSPTHHPPNPTSTEQLWSRSHRRLLAKLIGEFCYEELLTAGGLGDDRHRIELPGPVTYEFVARRGAYGSWFVDPDSLLRNGDNDADVDALRFVAEAQSTLGIGGDTAGHLVAELSATLRADHRLAVTAPTAAELADLPYAQVEGYQTGHPWIVPNKGRVGFSASDVDAYAPESRRPIRLPWLAVHRELATYHGVDGLTPDRLYTDELDADTLTGFIGVLRKRGADPDEYLLLPVHPWQLDRIITPLFAGDLAAGRIVPLGEAPDEYLPQQSIRTFGNLDHLGRHHVKLPLSILNTLVWRGLPNERTEAAPAVTTWILEQCAADPRLSGDTGPVLLGEVASVSVRHETLESVAGVPYQYRELFGAIWRESLHGKLHNSEHARTLAALLYVDGSGGSLVAELVRRSGLPAVEWLRRLFGAMLPPLLHFLYRYGVVFSPHGENAIVVYDETDVPVRLAIKDFVDDVNISDQPLPELAEVAAVLLREAPDALCQFIHAGLFVGHFRYLAELCRTGLDVAPDTFWSMVRAEIEAYQKEFDHDPEMRRRFELFDLFSPQIDRLCLNRNRLVLDGYADRPERPHAAVHGTVPNPLARP